MGVSSRPPLFALSRGASLDSLGGGEESPPPPRHCFFTGRPVLRRTQAERGGGPRILRSSCSVRPCGRRRGSFYGLVSADQFESWRGPCSPVISSSYGMG